jgi:hypothetical protein
MKIKNYSRVVSVHCYLRAMFRPTIQFERTTGKTSFYIYIYIYITHRFPIVSCHSVSSKGQQPRVVI